MEEGVTARFWAKVALSGPDDCWLWTAGRDSHGYGVFWLKERSVAAHRLSYELTYGPIPEGLIIRHRVCDNPPCVNPRHLLSGSYAQNTGDSVEKGRHHHGESHHFTPLTAEDVVAIRTAHVESGARPHQIAGQYGISKQAVIAILKGHSWKSVHGGVDVYVRYAKDETAHRKAEIARLRAEGMTQAQVAERLGVTQAAVSYIERRQG